MFSLPRDLSRPRDEQSSDFMDRTSSRQVNILQSLVAIDSLVVEFIMILVCQEISQKDVIKE